MKHTFTSSPLFSVLLLLVLATLSSALACGGGDEEEQPDSDGDQIDPSDGDLTACITNEDCQNGFVCIDRICRSVGDGDEEEGCVKDRDCPPGMKCNIFTASCEPSGEDGDLEQVQAGDREIDPPLTDGDLEEDAVEEDTAEAEEEQTTPELIARFLTPTDGSVLDGAVSISLDLRSNLIIEAVILKAGEAVIAELDSPPWTTIWQTAAISDGSVVNLRVTAFAGEIQAQDRISVTVDHSGPGLEIIKPELDRTYHFTEDFLVTVEASDHLAEIVLFIDEEEISRFDQLDALGSYTYPILSVGEIGAGEHELEVEVRDVIAAHEAARASRIFKVDEAEPLITVEGPTWSVDDPTTGEMFAGTALIIGIADPSGLKSASVTIRDEQDRLLLTLDETDDFPYTIDKLDALLIKSSEMYPVELTMELSATDNLDNTAVPLVFSFTVKRLHWTYDPAAQIPGFDPPPSFEQQTGAAATLTGDVLYAALYNELQAISPSGEFLWSCRAPLPFYTTPVVTGVEGGPPVIITTTQDGTYYFKIDEGSNGKCHYFRPDTGIEKPTPPVLESIVEIQGGYQLTLFLCSGRQDGGSNCYKYIIDLPTGILADGDGELGGSRADGDIDPDVEQEPDSLGEMDEGDGDQDVEPDVVDDELEHDMDLDAGDGNPGAVELTATRLWKRSFDGGPPSAISLPTAIFDKPAVAAGAEFMRLDAQTGLEYPGFWPHNSQNIQSICPAPGSNIFAVVSEKILRTYHWTLENHGGPYSLVPISEDKFFPFQTVSDTRGTLFLTTQQYRVNSYKAFVQAIQVEASSLGGILWEFETEGLPGGAPAVGLADILYVAGSNTHGNIWALDIYDNVDPPKQSRWQIRLHSPITTPLLITPGGDLIAVSNDCKIFSVEIRGNSPPGDGAWPMSQGAPDRSGYYAP